MNIEPVVRVQQGYVKGKICKDFYGGRYLSFQGIPYAKPPIGKLRFKAPKPSEPWLGVLDCTKEGSEPFSKNFPTNKLIGSESCLFLNVYTTQLSIPKPVMFWIHGGAFVVGSGNTDKYGPDFLIGQDVVIVTLNYRLGIFGFLCFKDKSLDIPGNAGVKDMVLALNWVQENILQFGGDPNNVTVFGESVGAVAIHYLILSPIGKGLFHKAILQSGCALGTRGQGQWSTPLLKKALQINNASDKEIYNLLQDMTSAEILQLHELIPDTYFPDVPRPFGIVLECYETEHTVIRQNPLDVIKSGNYNKIPIIFGYTSREGYLMDVLYGETKVHKDFQRQIPFTFKVVKESRLSKIIASEIKEFYFGCNEATLESSNDFFLLAGDNLFVRPIYNSARYHAQTSHEPVYLFRMSLDAKLNFFKTMFGLKGAGVSHADELGYMFTHKSTPKIRPQSIEACGIQLFTKLWTNFAKYGNPNSHGENKINICYWKPIQRNIIHFSDIGENFTTGINPENLRMKFWGGLERKLMIKN